MSENISQLIDQHLKTFAEIVRDGNPPSIGEEGEYIAQSLANLGQPAVPYLIAALNDKTYNPPLSVIAGALGKIGDERAIEPLTKLFLESGYGSTALQAFPVERILPTMDQALPSQNPPVIIGAMLWFADKHIEGITSQLLPFLNHPDARVRSWAIFALGVCGDSSAVAPLIHMLSLKDIDYRLPEALGRLKDVRAVDGLITLLDHGDPTIQSATANALGSIGDPRAAPAIINYVRSRTRSVTFPALETAITFDPVNGFPLLLEALYHQSSYVVTEVIRLLGDLGDPRAIEPIQKLLHNLPAPGGWAISQAASVALEKLGSA